SEDCRLEPHEDAFGNLTHSFTVDGPISELRIGVEGEVETQDTAGIVRGTLERFPPSLFLRETELPRPDDAIARFAPATRSPVSPPTRQVPRTIRSRGSMHCKRASMRLSPSIPIRPTRPPRRRKPSR